MNKNKKIYITIGIIILAIVLLIISNIQQKKSTQDEFLPTRDTEGFEAYASIEEFCTDLTSAQEFDDANRARSFYEECLVSNSL